MKKINRKGLNCSIVKYFTNTKILYIHGKNINITCKCKREAISDFIKILGYKRVTEWVKENNLIKAKVKRIKQ